MTTRTTTATDRHATAGSRTAVGEARTPSRRFFPAVAASLVAGLLLPLVLALGPAVGGGESRATGAVLLGWGIGWALLAVLSSRFTDRPQRWALVPAGILGVTGFALIALAPGAQVMDLLAWVWPIPVLALAAWLLQRVRRDVPGRSRWLLYPVVGALAMLAVGGAMETVIEATDGGAASAAGELVDVGGHRMYLECTGSGSPTVVLEGGLGQGSAYVARIAPLVASTTRVCAYDRAGRGHSDAVSSDQDAIALAHDLHALLVASGNPGPYVLAGHSAGGLYVRVFAATYPDEVAGVVLLDAQSPHLTPASATGQAAQSPIGTLAGMLPALARVGVMRLVLSGGSSDLPPDVEASRHAQEITAKGVSSFVTEFLELDHMQDAVAVLPGLGDRPLVVVTAVAESRDGWLDQQDRLATLSTNSSHREYQDLTHISLIESETGALASSEAIESVVRAIRSGTSLDGSTAGHQ